MYDDIWYTVLEHVHRASTFERLRLVDRSMKQVVDAYVEAKAGARLDHMFSSMCMCERTRRRRRTYLTRLLALEEKEKKNVLLYCARCGACVHELASCTCHLVEELEPPEEEQVAPVEGGAVVVKGNPRHHPLVRIVAGPLLATALVVSGLWCL